MSYLGAKAPEKPAKEDGDQKPEKTQGRSSGCLFEGAVVGEGFLFPCFGDFWGDFVVCKESVELVIEGFDGCLDGLKGWRCEGCTLWFGRCEGCDECIFEEGVGLGWMILEGDVDLWERGGQVFCAILSFLGDKKEIPEIGLDRKNLLVGWCRGLEGVDVCECFSGDTGV